MGQLIIDSVAKIDISMTVCHTITIYIYFYWSDNNKHIYMFGCLHPFVFLPFCTLAFIALAACHLPLVSFIALSHHNWFWFWFWYTGTLHHNTTHLQWCQEAKKNNKTLTGAAKDVLTVGKHVLKWYGCACLNPCGAASLLILTLMLIEVGSI